ncbi:acetyl/propionyl/methylcrotonyl-CoA carboxylase subunit alpha [Alcanivorax sp. 1008]|uniref:acetyl/propionyl/methylcrotonyl-CoA carboxylase subunit alpha n=1 Tax=Alcanivorax sp. 1008 TaxID=2816853 RepID=UPI001D60F510|nr:acetyl/propionyl/methylcrotonyl-CoA carboxylase subunit alpha [Alcanivorax sp. 1008]MCC1497163.1 acetyl/propionyl/methylcrotonyl-CoA carboxylase subunit alpha [Alcanivorax sp. 1008]
MAFEKILIANRGEIACRVIRTAHSLGYRTVAVYSEADRDARHVALADEAICIGPATVSQSYLDADAIIAAAQKTGADAVHPGYGFLSENSTFAEACEAAGITFIGPPVNAIHLMGSKRLSKIAMQEAGVPCIPGYEGADQTDATLIQEAGRIGLPLMIKASAGGGGRGMRVVTDMSELAEQLRSARAEAKSAFGSDELILERAVMRPRHVEIQVFGDQHGNIIHLGERDCSVQRRHQKVVEEAPSPAVSPALRAEMGAAAVNAARSCKYVGAGTVEFLLAEDGSFYFLEMNTRLQVEHPVTELVTGLDLVAWQIRVARGETLPLTQSQVQLNGHAIEVRLYAEEPSQNFMPQTGPVLTWTPAEGDGIRIDHGLREGSSIGSHYDPMLAKIIAYGDSREDARRRLIRAIEDTVLFGLQDNRRFLAAILRHPVFAAGDATTAFLDSDFGDDPSMATPQASHALYAIAAALLSNQKHASVNAWHSSDHGAQPLILGTGESRQTVMLQRHEHELTALVGDQQFTLNLHFLNSQQAELSVNGVRRCISMLCIGHQLWLDDHGQAHVFTDLTHLPVSAAEGPGSGQLKAPMDGAVIAVRCEPGQQVNRGEVLVVMEAMKMEHSLKASADGVVSSVDVKAGDQVKGKQILLTVEH